MSFQIMDILAKVVNNLDASWVFAVVTDTQGHCYRKSGALMFVDQAGEFHGMLSGGCLEGDIVRQTRRVFADGRARKINYDFSENSEDAWQFGMGCGGTIEVLLVLVDSKLKASFKLAYERLLQGQSSQLFINRSGSADSVLPFALFNEQGHLLLRQSNLQPESFMSPLQLDPALWLGVTLKPSVNFLIVGSGPDIIPLWHLCESMAWQVTIIDETISTRCRQTLPRARFFSCANENMATWLATQHFSAVVIMTHNIIKDALFLEQLQHFSFAYLAMLGPRSRTEKVFENMTRIRPTLHSLRNPVGLDLGGELPESVALAIVSECHAVLFGGSMQPISEKNPPIQALLNTVN